MAILAFHNIEKAFTPGITSYSPKRFKTLIKELKSAGYKFISVSEYIATEQEKNAVTLTFDDGYESFFDNALPILIENSAPAMVFMPVGYINKKADWDYSGLLGRAKKHMSTVQIKECLRNGIDFGSHGYSHIDLTSVSARMIELELRKSKSCLEDISGKGIEFIGYPFGRYNEEIENIAAEIGYRCGFSLSYLIKSKTGFTLPRYAVYSTDTVYSVLKKIGSGPFQKIEQVKGTIINSLARGTIILNKLRLKKSILLD